jgi:UDP-2-acetamido-2,6-beta-L-arabino-hexul-4-ose reductase
VAELDTQASRTFAVAPEVAATDITLGELGALIQSFRSQRSSLVLPNFGARFTRALYATYLSYLPPPDFAYPLMKRTDNRGSLAEFVKQGAFGQIFVSRTKPGITRGNHFHNTKTEKFLVVEGQAVIRFRHVNGTDVESFAVDGDEYRVVDIPPGYTHSIENVGQGVLVTLFWSSEVFNPELPDTYALPVFE